mmetsp:Transcript_31359/g.91509  ORF Transcript_31359/g.91509 Transcript_31359/m.91509 type:complete len:339 (-) Transcript_31359:405-1421(-)
MSACETKPSAISGSPAWMCRPPRRRTVAAAAMANSAEECFSRSWGVPTFATPSTRCRSGSLHRRQPGGAWASSAAAPRMNMAGRRSKWSLPEAFRHPAGRAAEITSTTTHPARRRRRRRRRCFFHAQRRRHRQRPLQPEAFRRRRPPRRREGGPKQRRGRRRDRATLRRQGLWPRNGSVLAMRQQIRARGAARHRTHGLRTTAAKRRRPKAATAHGHQGPCHRSKKNLAPSARTASTCRRWQGPRNCCGFDRQRCRRAPPGRGRRSRPPGSSCWRSPASPRWCPDDTHRRLAAVGPDRRQLWSRRLRHGLRMPEVLWQAAGQLGRPSKGASALLQATP